MQFVRETIIKAIRKQRPCAVCHTPLAVGSPAVYWAGKVDGDFHACTFHPDCRQAELEFNHDVQLGDWYSLRDNRERDDDPWLLAKYPAVADRLGIKTEVSA